MIALRFTAQGEPIPQGSTRSFVVNGKAVTTNANKKTKPWRALVSAAATEAVTERVGYDFPLVGPVGLSLTFVLPRPKTVKRKYPTAKPDLDKLVRAVKDSLADAGVYLDDSQVISLLAVKTYVDGPGDTLGHPGVVVAVKTLPLLVTSR